MRAYLSLDKKKEANEVLFKLIARNTENWKYYQDLTFPTDSASNLLEYCKERQAAHRSSRTTAKIPLTLTEGTRSRYTALYNGMRHCVWRELRHVQSLFQERNFGATFVPIYPKDWRKVFPPCSTTLNCSTRPPPRYNKDFGQTYSFNLKKW